VCTHPIDPMGIHFLLCVHGNECIKTHDVIHDTFVAITWNAGFHLGRKKLHAFPSITFNSSCWRVDIVDWTRTDLLLCSYATQGFATSDVTRTKERSYRNRHPSDQILPLVIEVFGCLHKHVDVFLHDCANAILSLKGTKGLHLSTLVTFLCQKVSIILQRMQTSFILSQGIVIGLATFRLPPLHDTPPITMTDLL
jgi:hypothetical protein